MSDPSVKHKQTECAHLFAFLTFNEFKTAQTKNTFSPITSLIV